MLFKFCVINFFKSEISDLDYVEIHSVKSKSKKKLETGTL